MAIPHNDPPSLRFSVELYRLMLRAYPAAFRREYGPWMLQAFRDSGRAAVGPAGSAGLLAFWGRTLFDWFKTVLEENLQRDTEMTRTKFIRLSGWGLVLSAVMLTLGMLVDSNRIRESLYRIAGPPVTRAAFDRYVSISESVGFIFGLFAILLLIAGLHGLRMRYAKSSTHPGRESLSISIFGGWFAVVGILSLPFIEISWWIFVLGLAILFSGLAVFGFLSVRGQFMPRGNVLPITAGAFFPIFILASILYEIFFGADWLILPPWLDAGLIALTCGSLALLGVLLAQDATNGEPQN